MLKLFYIFALLASCDRRGDEEFVAYRDFGCLDEELGHADVAEVFDALAHIHLALSSFRTVGLAPFAQALAQVVTIPEATVEDSLQAFVPRILLLFGKGAVEGPRST